MKLLKVIVIIIIIAIAINLFLWYGLKSQKNPENIKENDLIIEREN